MPTYPGRLAALFFIIAIVLLDMAIERTMLYRQYPHFGNIGKMLATALPGLVYLYARMSYMEHFRLHWYDALHSLPLLLKGSAALFGYHLQPTAVKIDYWYDGWQTSPINWPWLSSTALAIYAVQVILLARLVYRHRQALLQVRSNTLDNSYRLLKVFVGAYTIQLILNTSRAYLIHVGAFSTMQTVTTIMGVWIYIVVILLLLDLILGSDRRNALSDEELAISGFDDSTNTHAAPSPINENEYWQQLDEMLDTHMRNHKPFLDANLTLLQLARKLGVPARDLSSYINSRFKRNFSDYIADWRINEVKTILTADDFDGSITDAMYNAGFNSKSTFNTHFKKRTGKTPSQWRKSLGSLSNAE